MSPAALKLFFASGFSLLAGGVLGGLVTRAIYGDSVQSIDPLPPREKPCPVCQICQVCPPLPDCNRDPVGELPTSTTSQALFVPDEDEDLDPQRRSGLPASAIQAATAAVRQGFTPCLEEAIRIDARGTILLDLTVTATGGQAFISEAAVARRSDDSVASSPIETCLVENARRTRFDIAADDGEARFRVPIKIRRD